MPSIALIDNQPELVKLYQDTLALKGHTVAFVVSSCAEAYEKLKAMEKKPDMIVVSFDHKSEALNKIKSEYPGIIIKEVKARGQKK